MANELNIQLDPFNQTGLVLLGKVFDKDGTQQGSSTTLTENAPALYSGDFSLASISDNAYLVRFETNLPDELYGTGALYVRNNAEVSQENFFSATLDVVVTDTASRDASKADVSGIETKTEADARQVTLISEHDQTQTDISNLNDFDPATQDVNTNVASRDASKADLSAIETKAQADTRQGDLISEHDFTQLQISNLNDISESDVQSALTTQGYTTTRANSLDNLDATISSRATQTSVDNLQNNSTFQATIPPQIQRPETGTETFDLFVRLFDSSGDPTDPSSSNAMTIKVIAQDGTVLTNTTAMTRTGVGAFEYEAILNSTTALGQYNVFFDYDVNDTAIEQVRTLQYVESVATIDQVQTTVDNIETIIGVPTNGTIALDIASRESEASASSRETTNSAEHLATQNDIAGLNDFDPSTEDVNTNTISRDASKADVSGLSTFNSITDEVVTDAASRNASKATITNLATQASVNNIPTNVDTQLTTAHGSGSWQQTTVGTVSANITQVNGSNVNIDDFKADVTDVATKDNQESINSNVKKASLLIPASENLPDA